MTERATSDFLNATQEEIRADMLLTQAILLREALAAVYGTMRRVRRNRAVKGQWQCPYCAGVGIAAEDVHHREGCALATAEYALLVTADLNYR